MQEKIAADLREKMKQTSLREDAAMDGVDDMRYLEGTKKTTTLAWAWGVIAVMAIGIMIMFLIQGL